MGEKGKKAGSTMKEDLNFGTRRSSAAEGSLVAIVHFGWRQTSPEERTGKGLRQAGQNCMQENGTGTQDQIECNNPHRNEGRKPADQGRQDEVDFSGDPTDRHGD
jgi:hypothetical protein